MNNWVIIGSMVDRTGNEYPWFQAARREGTSSKCWNYYVWNEQPPADARSAIVLHGK